MRYFDSVKLLGEAVKSNNDMWGSFDCPELEGEPKDFDDSLFREKINAVMDARKTLVSDRTAWAKCRHAVQCAFTAFSPFAKHFLTIAKDCQAVFAHSLSFSTIDPDIKPLWVALQWSAFIDCGENFLFNFLIIQITDKEIGRKEELARTLEYLSQQFAHLELMNVLPDDLEQREFVANRALDVRSASMMYLAVMIRHDATPLGTPGITPKYIRLNEDRQNN
jgi:hypothetical protein